MMEQPAWARSLLGWVLCGTLALAVLLGAGAPAHSAGFHSQGVLLSDSDAGRALFFNRAMRPGEASVACILITNWGPASADVRLYGTTRGTGLDRYLELTVVRGRGLSATDGSCRGFHADKAGKLFAGTLRSFPDSYAQGIQDRAIAWAAGQARAYRLVVSLRAVNATQGLTAREAFFWEARAT